MCVKQCQQSPIIHQTNLLTLTPNPLAAPVQWAACVVSTREFQHSTLIPSIYMQSKYFPPESIHAHQYHNHLIISKCINLLHPSQKETLQNLSSHTVGWSYTFLVFLQHLLAKGQGISLVKSAKKGPFRKKLPYCWPESNPKKQFSGRGDYLERVKIRYHCASDRNRDASKVSLLAQAMG